MSVVACVGVGRTNTEEYTPAPSSEVKVPVVDEIASPGIAMLVVDCSNTTDVIALGIAGVGVTKLLNISTAKELELCPESEEVAC